MIPTLMYFGITWGAFKNVDGQVPPSEILFQLNVVMELNTMTFAIDYKSVISDQHSFSMMADLR